MIEKAERDFNDCEKTIAAFSYLIPFPSRFQNDTQVAYFGFQANYILFYCIFLLLFYFLSLFLSLFRFQGAIFLLPRAGKFVNSINLSYQAHSIVVKGCKANSETGI